MAKRDKFTKDWILENGIPIVESYNGNLTIRALHYRLVSIGMTNTVQHYKRVVAAMGFARWEGLVAFEAFQDHDRQTIGSTRYKPTNVMSEVDSSMSTVEFWLSHYSKNRWENQPQYVEVFIEKKALQGAFGDVCGRNDVALNPCKGYASLTYINDAGKRFVEAIESGKKPLILYFGDYDASGTDIPRSLAQNLYDITGHEIEVKVISLTREQCIKWNLPPAPAKKTDSRTANFMANGGLGQIELDAVLPEKLDKLCQNAIDVEFDGKKYDQLLTQEHRERAEYRKEIKIRAIDYMKELTQEDEEE